MQIFENEKNLCRVEFHMFFIEFAGVTQISEKIASWTNRSNTDVFFILFVFEENLPLMYSNER